MKKQGKDSTFWMQAKPFMQDAGVVVGDFKEMKEEPEKKHSWLWLYFFAALIGGFAIGCIIVDVSGISLSKKIDERIAQAAATQPGAAVLHPEGDHGGSPLQVPGRDLCFAGGNGVWFGGHELCSKLAQPANPDARLLKLRFTPVRVQLCVAESLELGVVLLPCRDLQVKGKR